ncbi:MAG TPA: hypothetical protein VI322_03300 [Candidatus Saccharimonadia bacterium]
MSTVVTRAATDRFSRLVVWCVVAIACTTLALMLFWQFAAAPASALQFRFNPFGLLSLASLLSNLVAFVLILRLKDRSDSLMWFSIFLGSLVAWAFGDAIDRNQRQCQHAHRLLP